MSKGGLSPFFCVLSIIVSFPPVSGIRPSPDPQSFVNYCWPPPTLFVMSLLDDGEAVAYLTMYSMNSGSFCSIFFWSSGGKESNGADVVTEDTLVASCDPTLPNAPDAIVPWPLYGLWPFRAAISYLCWKLLLCWALLYSPILWV